MATQRYRITATDEHFARHSERFQTTIGGTGIVVFTSDQPSHLVSCDEETANGLKLDGFELEPVAGEE